MPWRPAVRLLVQSVEMLHCSWLDECFWTLSGMLKGDKYQWQVKLRQVLASGQSPQNSAVVYCTQNFSFLCFSDHLSYIHLVYINMCVFICNSPRHWSLLTNIFLGFTVRALSSVNKINVLAVLRVSEGIMGTGTLDNIWWHVKVNPKFSWFESLHL